ncbi:MAG TPA: LCP family protein [Candidatus Saccharimonadales bacterium]|jgi:LCP family protein required for cell wall assembly
MDIHRPRPRPSQQPKAIDGFYSKPSGSAPRGRRPQPPTAPPVRSRVDSFNRTEGFHAAPRRAAGPTVKAPTSTIGTQSFPKQNFAKQFDEAPARGRTARKATKQAARGRSNARGAKLPLTRMQKFRKLAFRTTAVMLLLVLVGGGLLVGKGYFKLRKVFDGSSSAAALQSNVDPTKLKGEGDGRINIMLLGVGGAAHSGGDLTDTIMIASVDPINNQAVLFSVPRDLWVKMPNNFISNYQKINAAYESGKYKFLGQQQSGNGNKQAINAGFQAADSTVERVMGVPIHYNILVDFQAFRQAIDTVGGVKIDVKEQLRDPTMAWENGWNPVLAPVGVNHFDGKKALNYVRSRETSSDFARSQRQREVMVALKDKVMNMGTLSNPVKLSNLLSNFGDNVQTDISISDMTRMSTIMKKIPNNQIQSVGLADEPNNFLASGNVNGMSVLQPKAGLEDYTKIQTFVRSKLKDGYIAKENANISVLNGTVVPGLATEKGDELKSYGYNVGKVDNAPTPDYDVTTIYDLSGGSKKYTLNYLKKRYDVQTVKTTLPPGIVRGAENIVIILGHDATLTR